MLFKTLLASLVIAVSAARVDADVTLRMKFEAGKTTRQKLTMKQSMTMSPQGGAVTKMNVEQAMYQDLKCIKVTENVAELEQTLTRATANMQMPAPLNLNLKYDSDEKTASNPFAKQLDAVMRPMIGTPCSMKSDMLGKISDVKVSEEALKGIKNSQLGSLGGDLTSPEGLQRMTEQAAIQFPEGAMAVGHKWDTEITMNSPIGTMTMTRHHTYKGVDPESGLEKIEVTVEKTLEPSETPNPALQGAKVEMKSGSGKGMFLFDAKLGRLARSELLDQTEMEITAGNQVIPQQIDVDVVLEDVTGKSASTAP